MSWSSWNNMYISYIPSCSARANVAFLQPFPVVYLNVTFSFSSSLPSCTTLTEVSRLSYRWVFLSFFLPPTDVTRTVSRTNAGSSDRETAIKRRWWIMRRQEVGRRPDARESIERCHPLTPRAYTRAFLLPNVRWERKESPDVTVCTGSGQFFRSVQWLRPS